MELEGDAEGLDEGEEDAVLDEGAEALDVGE